MINRRKAIAAMGAATIAAIPSHSALARLLQTDQPGAAPKNPATDAIDDRLRQELAGLAARAYSEEGVPVFLACVDLAAAKTPQKHKAKLTHFNKSFAADFRQTADSWQRLHPDAPDTDVSKVIEVLADRAFTPGGKEPK